MRLLIVFASGLRVYVFLRVFAFSSAVETLVSKSVAYSPVSICSEFTCSLMGQLS